MATSYPTTFPSPQLDGLSAMVDMGLIKTDRPMNQAQRRLYATMPHTFSLTFNRSISTWGLWYNWVIANGFRWFTINLPSLYAGRTGDWASPVLVRFTSDLSAANITATDVRINVMAEAAPSMIATYLVNN